MTVGVGRFVVQGYRARRLRDDRRVELNGALVSWAGPARVVRLCAGIHRHADPDDFPHTAIVTGSDSGIGRTTAVALARAGCDVGVTLHEDRQGAEHPRGGSRHRAPPRPGTST